MTFSVTSTPRRPNSAKVSKSLNTRTTYCAGDGTNLTQSDRMLSSDLSFFIDFASQIPHAAMGQTGLAFCQRMRDDFQLPNEGLYASVRDDDLTVLRRFFQSAEGRRFLKSSSGGIHCWGTPLHVAVWCDHPAAIDILLEPDADIHVELRDATNLTPFALAARLGRRQVLRQLWPHIPRGRVHEHGDNDSTETCLAEAAFEGHTSMVRDILGWWADVPYAQERNALMVAAHRWQDNVVELLLARRSYPPVTLNKALKLAANLKPMFRGGEKRCHIRRGRLSQAAASYRPAHSRGSRPQRARRP